MHEYYVTNFRLLDKVPTSVTQALRFQISTDLFHKRTDSCIFSNLCQRYQ